MIVRILAGSPSFAGINYNTAKIDRNKGELMRTANFGPLQALGSLRPQDYINYLKMVSALNKKIRDPQFHATISARGKTYDKHALTAIAEDWLKEMGYQNQPYLVIFHKDTGNNHIHVVSTRVDRDGKKIPADFEKRRAVKNINKVLGYEYAFQYKFSTRAQFFLLLECAGYPGVDPNEQMILAKTNLYKTDKARAAEIKALLLAAKDQPEFLAVLKDRYQVELVFHASEGKAPYGYTIIDHQEKAVYKGSEVYSLRELIGNKQAKTMAPKSDHHAAALLPVTAGIASIWIADDVDDQQIHGMRRRRQRKARTNTR